MVGPIAQTAPRIAPMGVTPPGAARGNDGWINPAAAAALRANVELLKTIEEGIVEHFGDIERVRGYAIDLRTTSDMFGAAHDAVAGDKLPDNDQFLPLIDRAGTGVSTAESRLNSKEIGSTWPAERTEILSAIRAARVLTDNIARQLDPVD